jgi:hypothetical protein
VIQIEPLGSLNRHAYRTSRSASREKNYLCTFLNEMGERVDVFEGLEGETLFLTHQRDGSTVRESGFTSRAA